MVLDLIKYGHPILREKGKRVDRVTPEVRQLAADMLETMYAANGVGLAAQQVGRALQLTVIDALESELPWSGTTATGRNVDMPLILVNPMIRAMAGDQVGPEGCLSIPAVSADLHRAESAHVTARDLDGNELAFSCSGLLARAVQHELDHLNGILFIDRMDAATRASFAGKLKKLQKETLAQLGMKPKRRRSLLRM